MDKKILDRPMHPESKTLNELVLSGFRQTGEFLVNQNEGETKLYRLDYGSGRFIPATETEFFDYRLRKRGAQISTNLGDLMGPKTLPVKEDYPGPTLDDLLKRDFTTYNRLFMLKKDEKGKILEVYKKVSGKEYYAPFTIDAFEEYKTEAARRLKVQLRESSGKPESSA